MLNMLVFVYTYHVLSNWTQTLHHLVLKRLLWSKACRTCWRRHQRAHRWYCQCWACVWTNTLRAKAEHERICVDMITYLIKAYGISSRVTKAVDRCALLCYVPNNDTQLVATFLYTTDNLSVSHEPCWTFIDNQEDVVDTETSIVCRTAGFKFAKHMRTTEPCAWHRDG